MTRIFWTRRECFTSAALLALLLAAIFSCALD
jgi:hypothetical protein